MNWVKEYLKEIHSGNEIVSQKVRSVYEREVSWMDSPPEDFPFYFDEKVGQRPINFIEKYCKHSKSSFARKPVKLELFQKAKLQLVFGWLEKETGFRRITEVVDIRGRKCGKSTETAAVEWYMLLADGEDGGEIYCCANKLEQAKLVFNEAVNMRSQSEGLQAITKKRQSDIYCPATFGFIKALAADSKTMDGLNASFFDLDECHEARTSKIYDVMKQSQSARNQPLAWIISTNGFVREGFFDDLYAKCSNVANWEEGHYNYRLLPLIYELDSKEEWTDPKCWFKANPGLGKIKSIKTLAENVEEAKRNPKFLPTLLTKDFNIPENSYQSWLTYESIVNEKVVDMEYLRNSYAIGGCDLSSTIDLTCASLLIRKPNDDNVYVLQQYFLPQTRIDKLEQTSTKEAPYRTWAVDGWLTICEGAQVNYGDVTKWFTKMVREYNIRPLWVCYDRALAGYWVEEMDCYGFNMEKTAQGSFTWSQPMKEMGSTFEEHKVIYQNNPILRYCLHNTAKKSENSDGIESIKPIKIQKHRRIDGTVSLLNAWVGYVKYFKDYMRYVK
jgi:Phage terminase-like protein, large subunit